MATLALVCQALAIAPAARADWVGVMGDPSTGRVYPASVETRLAGAQQSADTAASLADAAQTAADNAQTRADEAWDLADDMATAHAAAIAALEGTVTTNAAAIAANAAGIASNAAAIGSAGGGATYPAIWIADDYTIEGDGGWLDDGEFPDDEWCLRGTNNPYVCRDASGIYSNGACTLRANDDEFSGWVWRNESEERWSNDGGEDWIAWPREASEPGEDNYAYATVVETNVNGQTAYWIDGDGNWNTPISMYRDWGEADCFGSDKIYTLSRTWEEENPDDPEDTRTLHAYSWTNTLDDVVCTLRQGFTGEGSVVWNWYIGDNLVTEYDEQCSGSAIGVWWQGDDIWYGWECRVGLTFGSVEEGGGAGTGLRGAVATNAAAVASNATAIALLQSALSNLEARVSALENPEE
ncbi:MAG: hypothetical protein IJS32_02765 [Kiritimatiellae bacterium]|nr:hypothetical protein [Kiritimatiellia bacterium]